MIRRLPMIGDRLANRYEVLSELGQGGMGVVYLGRDEVLGREVAIKVIAATTGLSDAAEHRFRGEAQTIAQLDHPSIVSIFDFGTHGGRFFYVMPVVEGRSLRELIDRKALSEAVVLEIGGAVAEALAYTHARGIVHRDIKPENIMVALGDEGRPRITLMDFGLARGIADDPLTKTGLLIGTVTYLSPEQVAGRVADAASDIYALGTVLYEALSGQPPFVGETQAVLYRIVHEYPALLRDRVEVDEELEALVMSCLAKEPSERPAQAGTVARALRQVRARHLRSGGHDEVTIVATALRRGAQAPLIGRANELGELQQRLGRALAGEGNFVVLGGEVGAGKTRLIAELEALARARGAAVLHGNLAEQAGAFPYFGFCELFVDYYRTRGSAGAEALPDLSDLAPELVAIFPALGEIESLRPRSGGEPAIEQPVPKDSKPISIDNRQQIFETIARALVRLAQATPLCLIFEDLHAADAAIEPLHYIVRRLAATPALIVATYRTTEVDRAHPVTRLVDELRSSRRFAHVVLGNLSKSEHKVLLGTLLGEAPPEAAAERLYEATEGNPLFTKELVRSLRSAGEAERADAWLMLSPGHLQGALPGTIQQAIDRRLARLPGDLREVLACAAVLGRSFDSRELAHLTRDQADLDDALDRLIAEGILEEEASRGDRLAFVSGATREVLYAQIPRRRRRGLHRRYAEYLEERYAGRLERVYPQLLHHYAEGDVPERSVHYGTLAARISLDSFSPEEAIRAARTAREFLDEEWDGDPEARATVHALLADAYRLAGDLDASLRELEVAIVEYQRRAQALPLARALLLASRTAWQARRTDDTRRFVELGIAAARALADEPRELAELLPPLLTLAGTLASLRGEGELATEYLREADALARPRAAEGPAPEIGGTVVVALASPAVASEPAAVQTQEDNEVLANVFETLLVADDDGHILPGLAERWQSDEGGRRFVFTLREGVRFHDGAPLRADDVVASLERLARLRVGALPPVIAELAGTDEFLAGAAPSIRGLRAVGELVVEFDLARPLAIFPALIATTAAAIARITDESAAAGILAAGTGPFRLVRHGVRSTVIERAAGHWRAPALVDAIEFRFLESAAAMVAGLRARELDVMRALVPEDVEDEALQGSGGVAIEGPVKLTYFAIFNAHGGPLTRAPEVRRALAHVVPVHELVWQLLGRFAIAASGLVPPGILGYDPGRRRPRLSHEEARALLAEAEVYAGATLRVLVFPVLVERYKPFLGALSDAWAALGLNVEIVRLDLATFIATGSIPANIDVVLLRWGADYDDPDDFTHGNFHSQSGRWRALFSRPELDHLVERGRAEADLRVRERIYRDVEVLLQREGAVLPLFHGVDHRIAGHEVRGMRLHGAPPFANYAELQKRSSPRRRPEAAAAAAIRVPMRGQVSALDPIRGGFAEVHEVLSCVFESLTRRVGGAQIVPWLAESLEPEGGGVAYRIRLRRDVTFHDGRRLTTRDVRYSFERMLLRADSTDRWLYAPIVGAQELLAGQESELAGLHIHSEHELTIELTRPLVYFPGLLSHSVCAIIPEGADRRQDLWQEHPAGTGPFRVVRFDPARRLELGRAPAYWRPEIPRARSLVFHFGAAPAEIRAGFEAGRYSLAGEMLPADVEALRRDPAYASGYRETPSFATYFIALNTRRGPLADLGLRKQIARAIDRPRLARQAIGRLARPAEGLIPPGLLGYESSRERGSRAVDTPQAGLRDLELTAVVHPVFHGEYRAYFRRLCDTLAVLGIKIRILDEAQSLSDLGGSATHVDLDITRWFADYPDAHSFVGLLHTREGRVGALCGSERVDRLLDRGQTTLDPQGRHAIYRQIEDIIAQEISIVPLFHPQTYRFARPEIEGLEVSHGGPMVAYEELSIRDGGES